MKNIYFLAIPALLLTLSGCETLPVSANHRPEPSYEDAAANKFTQANYTAVDNLLASLKAPLNPGTPIIVATLVNIDALTESSRLGRLVSEQLGARLTRLGYSVVELKLRGDIFVKQREGELLLSREVRDITASHKAHAVVVGTYSEARDYTYLNLKIVGVQNNIVLAAHDYTLPIDTNVRELLAPPKKMRNGTH